MAPFDPRGAEGLAGKLCPLPCDGSLAVLFGLGDDCVAEVVALLRRKFPKAVFQKWDALSGFYNLSALVENRKSVFEEHEVVVLVNGSASGKVLISVAHNIGDTPFNRPPHTETRTVENLVPLQEEPDALALPALGGKLDEGE
ncbi:MAG: hypothetical protein PHV42_03000 [Candidatus Pacebacteria bacterium]|nr:hypothetical protein [Candidatus Paceibacterota bacterium]